MVSDLLPLLEFTGKVETLLLVIVSTMGVAVPFCSKRLLEEEVRGTLLSPGVFCRILFAEDAGLLVILLVLCPAVEPKYRAVAIEEYISEACDGLRFGCRHRRGREFYKS